MQRIIATFAIGLCFLLVQGCTECSSCKLRPVPAATTATATEVTLAEDAETCAGGCANCPNQVAAKDGEPKPCCNSAAGRAAALAASTEPESVPGNLIAKVGEAATLDGWASVKGRIVFDGDKIPENEKANVDKDQNHCLAKGPIFQEVWTINKDNRGVKNVVVFLRAAPGATLPVHDSLKTPAEKDVVLDQPMCAFVPRIIAMRADQKLLAKNPAPVAHNVVINGFKNAHNTQIAPGGERSFELAAEGNPLGVSCGAHPWMKGSLWVFDHPYFAVTDENGNFEIKLAPAGKQTLVMWHEATGYLEGKKGREIDVSGQGTPVDLGVIKFKPSN